MEEPTVQIKLSEIKEALVSIKIAQNPRVLFCDDMKKMQDEAGEITRQKMYNVQTYLQKWVG